MENSSRPPNIILLLTDDQRHDTIAALGASDAQTPQMDQLVQRGTAWTRCHIQGGLVGAVCCPSRAMLHSGQHLMQLCQRGKRIPAEHALLGEALRRRGYHCFHTGKWHNGSEAFARSFDDGAEIFFGGMDDHWNVPACDFDPSGVYDGRLPRCPQPGKGKAVRWVVGDHVHAGVHSTDLFADASCRFIDSRRDAGEPFFLSCAFMAPHDPRIMPERFARSHRPEAQQLAPNCWPGHPFDNGELQIRDELLASFPRRPAEIREHLADYRAMISHLDEAIGRIITSLAAIGELDHSIILLAGDNGLALGQHGLMGKQNLYDHSLRVPLIMAGPGIPIGERREQLCYLHDAMPTLLDLVGATPPADIGGRSLLPALHDGAAPHRSHLHHAYRDCQRSVTDGRYKLIAYAVAGQARFQLFDLQADPWEMDDRFDDQTLVDQRSSLIAQLQDWRQSPLDDHLDEGTRFWNTVAPALAAC